MWPPRLVWALVVLGLLFLGPSWWLALVAFPDNEPVAVLHYSYELGIDFVGQGKQIIALPIIGSILLVFNIFIGWWLYRIDRRAAWVIWVIIPLIEVIINASLWLLWRANM